MKIQFVRSKVLLTRYRAQKLTLYGVQLMPI